MCYPAGMLLTCLFTLEILSTLRLPYTSCGSATTDFIPDVTTADGPPKLVWLQQAPVSVLNQILNQTHSLSLNQPRVVQAGLSST